MLQLNHLSDKSVHIAGYSREDPGVSEYNEMDMDELMFCHRRFVWMSKLYVTVEFFYSGLYRLSDVPLTTFTRYAVNPRSLQSQVVLN